MFVGGVFLLGVLRGGRVDVAHCRIGGLRHRGREYVVEERMFAVEDGV